MNVVVRPCTDQKGISVIYIENEEWKKVHFSLWKKTRLPPCNNLEELHHIFFQTEYRLAKQYTFACLAARSYPSHELEKKLADKLVSEVTIQRVIHECKELGYVDDQQWVESFIRQKISKKYGPKLIFQKLLAKGFDSHFAREQIASFQNSEMQKESVHHLLTTKYKHRDLQCRRERQKVIQALLRKGFPFSIIQEVIDFIS